MAAVFWRRSCYALALLSLALLSGCGGSNYADNLSLYKNRGAAWTEDMINAFILECQARFSAPGTSCGNPINYATGNKYQTERDYQGGGPFPLVLTRHYNSQDADTPLAFGAHWHAPYGRFIAFPTATTAEVTRDDGRIIPFTLTGSAWTADPDVLSRLTRTATGWIYTTGGDATEHYDANGRLQRVVNRAGLAQTFSYNSAGNLATITDPFGRQLRFSHRAATGSPVQLIHEVVVPDGGIYSYEYSTNNNLTAVTYPDGSRRQYLYENASIPHALTGVIDENGSRFATYAYMTQSTPQGPLVLATSTEHAGAVERYALNYNNAGSGTIVVTQPLGGTHTYQLQALHGSPKLNSISRGCSNCTSGGSGGSTSTSYDANGNPVQHADFTGNVTTYTYDPVRNLELSRTEAAGTLAARTIATTWHSQFRLPLTITEPNRTTTFEYDSRGNLLRRAVRAGTQERVWTYTYNSASQVLSIDGPRTDVTDTTLYSYDGQGNLASITNARGQVVEFTSYDVNGRPLSMRDANGLVTQITWNFRGQLTSRTTGSEVTAYNYDAVGNVTRVTGPDGSFLNFTYDAAHRLADVRDETGNHIAYTLDAAGNVTLEETFDPTGTRATTHTRVFDGLGRMLRDVGAQNQATHFTYDNNANVVQVRNPLNGSVLIGYDALNRVAMSYDEDFAQTRFAYDSDDQLTRVTDPRNLVTTYTYNGFGDQVGLDNQDAGFTSSSYDSSGNLAQSTDAAGRLTNLSYDELGRVTEIRYSGGTASTALTYDEGVNGVGRLARMTDASGTSRWSYDAHGRITEKAQETNGRTLRIQYGYDASGRLSSFTYPSGARVQLSYANGRVAAIGVDGRSLVSNIAYQPWGLPRAWAWGNGAAYQRTFDSDGRLSEYPLGLARTRDLTFDAAGRIAAYVDTNASRSESFEYTRTHRLSAYTASGGVERYAYDSIGNRTSRTSSFAGSTNTNYEYSATSNRLVSTATSSQIASLAYDPTGNMVADGRTQFSYDGRNRLVQASNTQGVFRYLINGMGQRVAKLSGTVPDLSGDANQDGRIDINDLRLIALMARGAAPVNLAADCTHDGLVTNADVACTQAKIIDMRANPQNYTQQQAILFVYDEAGHLIGEYDSTGRAIRETVYFGDTPIAVLAGGSEYFIYADHLDAPRLITNRARQVVWNWEGNPFGTSQPNQDPSSTGAAFVYNLRFPGQYYDAESGLHYNMARDYNPATGRYVQADPIGLDGGVDLYGYAGANPLSFTDPSGNVLAGGAAVGVITGYALARLTGECYGLGDAARDAFLGAIGAGLASKVAKLAKLRRLARLREAEAGAAVSSSATADAAILSRWAQGTFDDAAESVAYHFQKHGAGRTLQQYTDDAARFFEENRSRAQWGKWNANWAESFRLKIGDRAGYYTADGKILTYWD